MAFSGKANQISQGAIETQELLLALAAAYDKTPAFHQTE